MRRYWKWFETRTEQSKWEIEHKKDIKVCMRCSGEQLNQDLHRIVTDGTGYVTIYRFLERDER